MSRRKLFWRRRSGLAAGLAAVGLMLAGCVNLPSAGPIYVNSSPDADTGNQLVITPRAPGAQWLPNQIVAGFLVASGANPDDLSIARDYLTGTFAKAWHPGSSPDVIDSNYGHGSTEVPARVTGGQSSDQVTVTTDHLEKLVPAGPNEAGRLQVQPGRAPYMFKFELIQSEGKWRIESILGPDGKASDSILLLTESDFERDYVSRNLYYVASGSSRTLVPYPVYIPAQADQLSGVQQLVDALGAPPPTESNWLYLAIKTAFPRHTKLTAAVTAGTVAVTVSGKGANATPQTLSQMEAQLVWTLTYAPDSVNTSTGISSVKLRIGRRSSPQLGWSQLTSWIPEGPQGPLYYQTLDQAGQPSFYSFTPSGNFGSLSSSEAAAAARTHGVVGGTAHRVPLPGGFGRGPLTTVAVSPTAAGGVNEYAGCRGKSVYVAAPLPFGSEVLSTDLPGNCTSLSWDAQGDLWAVAGYDVDVLNETPTGLQVIPVSIPDQPIASDNFVSLKVAPDGLRVAMIVRGKNGASVYVSAITKRNSSTVYLAQGGPVLTVGPDLVDPIALTWWDSDHLLVLEHRQSVAELYDVSLNGGVSTKVVTAPANAVSVTANGQFIAVGTAGSAGTDHPTVVVARGLDGSWIPVTAGRTPAYIG